MAGYNDVRDYQEKAAQNESVAAMRNPPGTAARTLGAKPSLTSAEDVLAELERTLNQLETSVYDALGYPASATGGLIADDSEPLDRLSDVVDKLRRINHRLSDVGQYLHSRLND